ncbi:MAG: DUF4837 family protein [Bacteroidales bacterium]|nr:DUF4837 family protein [Bacteroidales bacterium]
MRNIKMIIMLMLAATIATACKKTDKKQILPSVKGEANSVVLVMSGTNWESKAGEIIRESFGKFMPALPQDEPLLKILFVPHSSFDKVYQKQRNILITLIGPDYPEKITVQNDRWAAPQLVITIMAPNKEAFTRLFEQKADEITERIIDAEKDRLMADYKFSTEKKVYDKLLSKHHIKINAPKGYTIDADTNNFIWLGNEYRDIIEGIFIYYYPYTDSLMFTPEALIKKRDGLLEKYVPGEIDGSYMITENRVPVEVKKLTHNNRYAVELRGLWMMKNGMAMGGPFVSLTQYDEKNKRIITAEGFVFAPGQDKRNLVRRIEAIIYSLDFEH